MFFSLCIDVFPVIFHPLVDGLPFPMRKMSSKAKTEKLQMEFHREVRQQKEYLRYELSGEAVRRFANFTSKWIA